MHLCWNIQWATFIPRWLGPAHIEINFRNYNSRWLNSRRLIVRAFKKVENCIQNEFIVWWRKSPNLCLVIASSWTSVWSKLKCFTERHDRSWVRFSEMLFSYWWHMPPHCLKTAWTSLLRLGIYIISWRITFKTTNLRWTE